MVRSGEKETDMLSLCYLREVRLLPGQTTSRDGCTMHENRRTLSVSLSSFCPFTGSCFCCCLDGRAPLRRSKRPISEMDMKRRPLGS